MKKYDKDGSFSDPVVRCDSCQKLLERSDIQKYGCCKHCGGRKIRNVLVFSPEEKREMEQWGIDPDFLALFEGKE
jgi:uncharacterized CHY-type Zn-finger protein